MPMAIVILQVKMLTAVTAMRRAGWLELVGELVRMSGVTLIRA